MKKIRTIRRMNGVGVLLCVLSLSVPSFGQPAYKGRLFVNEESFLRRGELLEVRMKVSYDGSVVNPGESLTFTPVIKDGSHVSSLSSVVINGDRREKTERRAEVLGRLRRINMPVAVRDGRRGEYYFTYDTTIPYEEWMAGGSLYSESEECSCNGRRGLVFEDLLLKNLPLSDTPQSNPDPKIAGTEEKEEKSLLLPPLSGESLIKAVQFLRPSVEAEKTYLLGGTLSFEASRDLRRPGSDRFNRRIREILSDKISGELSLGAKLSSIRIHGFGAPRGNYRRNESSAMKHALSLKEALMEGRFTNCNSLDVSWQAEDWDSISSLVSRGHMSLKAAVLNVIGAVDVVSGRERELRKLNHGLAYRYLKTNVFPHVSRLDYTLCFSRRSLDAKTGLLLLRDNPKGMSLDDLYAVALNYLVGSREFDDLMDLGARLFPGSAEARINAAGVSLLRGDASGARKNLDDLMTDPRAYNNIGLLYLLEGNFEKSEVYLRMAGSAGVSQAEEGLKLLEKQKSKKQTIEDKEKKIRQE